MRNLQIAVVTNDPNEIPKQEGKKEDQKAIGFQLPDKPEITE